MINVRMQSSRNKQKKEGWLSQVESTAPLTRQSSRRFGGSNPSPSASAWESQMVRVPPGERTTNHREVGGKQCGISAGRRESLQERWKR